MSKTHEKSLVVISAHSGDFVWRAGLTVATAVSQGHRVHVICLSFGECRESQGRWQQPSMHIDTVRAISYGSPTRRGLTDPVLRPICPGARVAGRAITVLSHPGDNLMVHARIAEARNQAETGKKEIFATGRMGLDLYDFRRVPVRLRVR